MNPVSLSLSALLALGVALASYAQSNADRLAQQQADFEKRVIKVTEGVYVAVGHALANSILIEGDDGLIVVDTTESPAAAREVLAEFRAITSKPVHAIVYTHFHADHIAGAREFAEDNEPEVYAHATTADLVSDSYGMLAPTITRRSLRQFGVLLPLDQHLGCGIGPRLRVSGAASASAYLPATQTVEDSLALTVAGVRMELVHAPGETSDQLYVWLPDKKVLLPGDNFYKSFPNLYAIRGTKYRDVRQWADSLDRMIAEGAEYLVPSHTLPITGAEEIRTRLSNYRDAIRFVHDETVKGINRGMSPGELAAAVTLPPRLAEDPWLVEYYGTVEWSVRNIFSGYLGWFDGNPARLSPLPLVERAHRVAELAGGSEALLRSAQQALSDGEYQWALELTDWLRALDAHDTETSVIRRACLVALGEAQISANGRNYYLSSAQQGR